MTSNLGDEIKLSKKTQLFLKRPSFTDQDLPYVEIREGMFARLSQNVRDDLIEKALEQDDSKHDDGALYLNIKNVKHPLGKWDE